MLLGISEREYQKIDDIEAITAMGDFLSSALCLIVQLRLRFLHKKKKSIILPNEKLHDSLQGPLICLINFLGVIYEIY